MSSVDLALPPGTLIRDLQVNAVLGSGATSVTYRVSDPALGTQFALKEYVAPAHVRRSPDNSLAAISPAAGKAFNNGLEQFLTEGRLLAGLEHPNIVRVLRYFEANGTAYLLMPYYPGKALDEQLRTTGKLDAVQTQDLMLPMMEGLAYLHGHGVIHQDIKPANVYMTDDHGPILLDFGVAAMGAKPMTGSRQGSQGYAALEQSALDGRIGPWTDIYGLAATLYRCVTGKVPAPAAARQKALGDGGQDPLLPLEQWSSDKGFSSIVSAIEQGLCLLPQDRPRSVGQWKTTFKSLDWRRSIPGGTPVASDPQEGREWLPRVLLGAFILLMATIGLFLLTDKGPPDGTRSPAQLRAKNVPVATDRPVGAPSAEETGRWHAALEADTTLSYRRFMQDFPASVYSAQARVQLEVLDDKAWQALSTEHSVAAFEDYLEQFPNGLHQGEAMQGIDSLKKIAAKRERDRKERARLEEIAWQAASDEHTLTALDEYIRAWPGGRHIEEAGRIRRLIKDQNDDAAAFASALKLDSKAAYQAYIDAFPKGANIAAALRNLDRLTLRPGKSFRDCDACPRMIVVPAGSYWQGSEESSPLALNLEKPRRMITFNRPFAVGVFEVTLQEWDACVANGSCATQADDNGWGRGKRPVIMVSWNDAEAYVRWLSNKSGQSYRLPSESEWEYFARAGENGQWLGGSETGICRFANIAGSETGFRWQHVACADSWRVGTAPVGTFEANAFGLYDVIGNVAEWTADCMNLSYLDAPSNGQAWGQGLCSSHMTRGGSWLTGTRDIRLPARFNLKNGDRNDFTGFRVVRSIKE